MSPSAFYWEKFFAARLCYNYCVRKHLVIKIHGLVQGVFFRHSARQKAKELKIAGFAKNEDYGSVYIEAEGEKEKLGQFLDWCRQGPSSVQVKKVESGFKTEIKNFTDFVIK